MNSNKTSIPTEVLKLGKLCPVNSGMFCFQFFGIAVSDVLALPNSLELMPFD